MAAKGSSTGAEARSLAGALKAAQPSSEAAASAGGCVCTGAVAGVSSRLRRSAIICTGGSGAFAAGFGAAGRACACA
eukprot:scaffold80713_cov42-Prasinocladus_malaysianus.AAC.1